MNSSELNPPPAPFSSQSQFQAQWNSWSAAPLNLGATLASGQNFRWRRNESGVWFGTIENCAAALWQAENSPDSPLYWQTFPINNRWDILRDYLRLNVDLEALYEAWKERGPEIAGATVAFRGLRILRQPPVECFFAFQCATCNTVTKIERSIARLAARYGKPIDDFGFWILDFGLAMQPTPPLITSASFTTDAQDEQSKIQNPKSKIHAFPTIEALADADEAELRADLWGYRAPRVINLARELRRRPDGWLNNLRTVPYAQAKAELMALHGIGAKLADCICLFSLDKDEAVPVDTHVRQIATRLFLHDLCGKSLTPRVYDALADSYRERFGAFAGWAQQYLFFHELRRSGQYKNSDER